MISPVSGAARTYPASKENPVETKTPKPGSKAAETKAQKERLDHRREEQGTEEWKERYNQRSGIEGVNRALDLKDWIFKTLRVRGIKALDMALYLKGSGWNVSVAAQITAKKRGKPRRRPVFGLKS